MDRSDVQFSKQLVCILVTFDDMHTVVNEVQFPKHASEIAVCKDGNVNDCKLVHP